MSVSATFDETFYLTNNADVVVAISQGFLALRYSITIYLVEKSSRAELNF